MKAQILSAARECFLADGVHGVSMRRIADRVGVTATAIYRHYKDKDELLDALTNEGFDMLERRFRALPPSSRVREHIHNLAGAVLDFAFAHPNHYEFIFVIPRHNVRRFPDDFAQRRSAAFNYLLDAVERGIRTGELKADRALDVALGLWGVVHGLVSLFLAGRFGQDRAGFREQCQRSVERMFVGIENTSPPLEPDASPGGTK